MYTPRLWSITFLKVLLGLCVAGFGFLLANVGCSSGAVCYRQTDCPSGSKCRSGQCVRDVALGDAGSTSEADSGTAGGNNTASTSGGNTASASGGNTAGAGAGGTSSATTDTGGAGTGGG